jgi:hypothetical protein
MSHVDEGLIHAYIDGAFPPGNPQGEEIEAHTALCVDCRVRLEKARELKERAQVVMHRLAPTSIATPPFEEVLARRDRQRAPAAVAAVPRTAAEENAPPLRNRRRSDIFPIPFAWAATVILAVGAGWMGRELMLNQRMDADRAAAVVEAAAPASPDAPPPPPAQGVAGADASALSDRGAAAAADRARQEAPQRQEQAAQAASGFAPPPAARKAADATVSQRAEARLDTAPIVLRGIDAVTAPRMLERRALGAAVSTVTAAENMGTTANAVLAAYVRATANAGWVEEPGAAVGIIGYEPPARIEGLDAVRSERAVVDSVELLRTVYVVEGDTVELVQRLKQAAIALESIVVTGVDRADTLAGRRPPVAAPPPPAARADDERAANLLREAERAALALDTASAFTGRSLVAVRYDERILVLISRMSEESLRAIAARIR